MSSRHEKCIESLKPTSQVVPPTKQVVPRPSKLFPRPIKMFPRPSKLFPRKSKAVVGATGSYTSLVAENKKLKKELEISSAANKIM